MDRLDYLKTLFDLLPDTFPSPGLEDSEFSRLEPFELEPNLLQRTNGDIPEAVSQHLHAIFYADGEISITERGPVITTVVQVLTTYLREYPLSRKLLQWREHLIKALEKILRGNGFAVPISGPTILGASTDNTKANDAVVPKKRRKDDSGSDDDETTDMRTKTNPAILKSLNRKPHASSGRGKPSDPILEKLTIKYVHRIMLLITEEEKEMFDISENTKKDERKHTVYAHAGSNLIIKSSGGPPNCRAFDSRKVSDEPRGILFASLGRYPVFA